MEEHGAPQSKYQGQQRKEPPTPKIQACQPSTSPKNTQNLATIGPRKLLLR